MLFSFSFSQLTLEILGSLGGFLVLAVLLASFRAIGPTEVGLVTRRFSFRKLANDNPIAFAGEPGYQANLLMPGLRWKLILTYRVEKFPWVQVPAGQKNHDRTSGTR